MPDISWLQIGPVEVFSTRNPLSLYMLQVPNNTATANDILLWWKRRWEELIMLNNKTWLYMHVLFFLLFLNKWHNYIWSGILPMFSSPLALFSLLSNRTITHTKILNFLIRDWKSLLLWNLSKANEILYNFYQYF